MHNLQHTVQLVLINRYTCVASTLMKIEAISITSKRVFSHSSCQLCPLQLVLRFLSQQIVLAVLELYTNGIIQYVLICICFFLFNISLLRFTHTVTSIDSSLFFKMLIGIYYNLSSHLFVCGHLSCFHVLTGLKKEAINPAVQVFLWAYVLISLWSDITRTQGGSITL